MDPDPDHAGDPEPDADDPGEEVSPPAERTTYDFTGLVSLLAEHDLARATHPTRADDDEFEFDPDRPAAEVFPQSVASGGPTPTGVILWTRIAPGAFDPDERLAVELARDESFEDVVYRGVVDDQAGIRAHDYTVQVDLDGVLDPDTEYCYRFVYGETASNVGRCRTLPDPGTRVEELSFAVLTCQNYLNGYYGALHHVAEEDVDFVIHVGDFVYESATGEFTGVGSYEFPDRDLEFPSGADRVETLADYRYLYRTYRADPLLQEALEAHTLIPAWDDHEIANDVYWDHRVEAPAADHPRGDDPEFMTRLTADAIHAWWEYMPARVEYDPDAADLQSRFKLWRSMQFGDLVDLFMTDERLFRSPPRDGIPTPRAIAPDHEADDRTMLGPEQRRWLVNRINDSDARWTVWSDEVLTIPLRLGVGPLTVHPVQGGWDGYTSERKYLTRKIADSDVRNMVTLTGDMHCYVAGYKQTEYRDAIERTIDGPVPKEKRVGVEFMTPPVTSLNVAEALGWNRDPTGITQRLMSWFVRSQNPHIDFFDSHNWGYSVVEFTREDCTYLAYSVDKHVDSPRARKELVKALRVPDDDVEIQDVTDVYRE